MWWGGDDADVGAMLEEYCHTFYGDAGPTMLEFFDFCETHYQAMEDELEPVETALAMFEKAKSSVKPDFDLREATRTHRRVSQRAPKQGRTTWSGTRTGYEDAHR